METTGGPTGSGTNHTQSEMSVSGLTPTEIDEAVHLVRRIRDAGTTVVFVEHVMRAVTALSDRIVVLDQGRVIAQGPVDEVMARDDVAAAYLGVAHA